MDDADWEAGLSEHAVILDLHGSNAPRGIELDAFQSFLDHFRRALREWERAKTARDRIGRAGRPGGLTETLTGFRLVRFREGSGHAALEPVEQYAGESTMGEPAPTRNLRSLLAAVEVGEIIAPVASALDKARKAIGDDGLFGVRVRSQPGRRVPIDWQTIERLQAAAISEPVPDDVELSVSGVLHLVEVYEPLHVVIRAPDGVDWTCEYDPSLEPEVLRSVKSLVWATGSGRRTGANTGSLRLRTIQRVPTPEQTSLFTLLPIPADELARQQGIHGPQGLEALGDPDWADDEHDRAFLAYILGDEPNS
jgi:hypothetical protein